MNNPPRKSIELMFFNAGGGHRAAASALDTVIKESGRPWDIRRTNLMKVLDPKEIFYKTTGMNWEDLYNTRLARGWSVGLAQELKLMQALVRLTHRSMALRLKRHFKKTRPDLVVSLIPNFNRPMYEGITLANPTVPYVTILTDFADYPPHFWIEPRQSQHFICGTPKAVEQALSMGYDSAHVHPVSGMIIRPDFYRESHINRRVELAKLGLDPNRPTGIVMFGGHGSRVMLKIAKRLDDLQLIMICGHNEALASRLRDLPATAPRTVLGFTSEIRYYMQLCDYFIGKPGPGSISEAVQQGLPVIVVHNTWTMPQERYNSEWIRESRAGVVLESFKLVRQGVDEVIARLPEFRASTARIRNRAVFEIPSILEHILSTPSHEARTLGPDFEDDEEESEETLQTVSALKIAARRAFSSKPKRLN
ncbi:MAG TPA: glycosyltransferase [Steroidobacteraceae bacterium]|nr:glycosyltransferase [Steroidobacteraceae bacterium]